MMRRTRPLALSRLGQIGSDTCAACDFLVAFGYDVPGGYGLIRSEHAKSAADQLLTAALLGENWAYALEQLAAAADAGGASLVVVQHDRPLAQVSSTDWAEAEAEHLAGRSPPSPLEFYPDHAFGNGFVVDHDVWTDDRICRDPYYQEFLRPRRVFFHAKTRLFAGAYGRVTLTLKRWLELGPYEPHDISVLDSLLPQFQVAFRCARRVLDAEASGVVHAVHQRGAPVFELDSWGRVLRVHANTDEGVGVVVHRGRLVTTDRLAHQRLEHAIAMAVTPEQRPALAAITDEAGNRRFLQLVPVAGRSRDVFLATAAVAVLIDPSRSGGGGVLPKSIQEMLGLTGREAQIAALLAEGLSLAEIAERLRLQIGTARNHLKRIFEKSGTRRQGELIALIDKLKF